MVNLNDWRLQGQEKYLKGETLFYKNYVERTTKTDHDHCEFCFAKFSDSIADAVKVGYTTADDYRWICQQCFDDFKEMFNWEIYKETENRDINGIIKVKARLYLKPTDEGGKTRGIKTGYRPNHVFEQITDPKLLKTYIGEIQFEQPEIINPGETATVTVAFLQHQSIETYMHVGQKWFIYEVPKLVGEGEIIEIERR
ncbi:MAG: hypothetical protein ACTHMD_07120 [Flavisolibacter sp.]